MQLQTNEPLYQIMLARYYEAGVGRFVSVDPVDGKPGAPQSWNRFAYVLNNPIRLSDPSGCVVESMDLEDEGPNLVPNPSIHPDSTLTKKDVSTLGPKSTPTGFFEAVNILARVSEGDSPDNYTMRQESALVGTVDGRPVPPGGADNPEGRNVARAGSILAGFDAPGAVTTPKSVPMGSSVDVTMVFKSFAVDKAGKQNGPTLYWQVKISHAPGDKKASISARKIKQEDFDRIRQPGAAHQ